MFWYLVALIIGLYTGNYALETWRAKNRFGAVALFALAALSVFLVSWLLGYRH